MAPEHDDSDCDVGVVGLGRMGLPLAMRLLQAGFRVAGNRRHEPPEQFLRAGGIGCSTPAQLADRCPVVITVLPTADALTATATGEHGLAATTRRGGIWVEMSTVRQTVKQSLADALAAHGWRTLDCPISGASDQLTAGEAVLLSSGERETHDRVVPLLSAISSRVSYLGGFGAGISAKETAYVLLAGHSLVAAEALTFAGRAGLDIRDVLTALQGTIVSSGVFDHRAPRVLDATESSVQGSLRGLAASLADLRRYATEIDAPTPVLDQAVAHLDRDDIARTDELIVAFYRRLTAGGTALPSPTGKDQP